MSFSDPIGPKIKMPADVFLKLDSRSADNKMYLTFRKEEGSDEQEKLEVDRISFAVLDENFMTVTGRVPGRRNSDGYLRCNITHYNAENQSLVVQETNGEGKVVRDVARGKWKTIEDTVKANGGKNTKQVYGLVTQVQGPDTARVAELNKELAKYNTIIKLDIKGNWWGMYLDLNKRIKVSNWEHMYIGLSQPLVAHENKGFGSFSYLPTPSGQKVTTEKHPAVYAACVKLDSGRMKEYRDYICGLDGSDEPEAEMDPKTFAAETGVDFDPEYEPTPDQAAEISGGLPPLPDTDLPF